MPIRAVSLNRSSSRAAPSSIEYSVCTCRCTKESDSPVTVTAVPTSFGSGGAPRSGWPADSDSAPTHRQHAAHAPGESLDQLLRVATDRVAGGQPASGGQHRHGGAPPRRPVGVSSELWSYVVAGGSTGRSG